MTQVNYPEKMNCTPTENLIQLQKTKTELKVILLVLLPVETSVYFKIGRVK